MEIWLQFVKLLIWPCLIGALFVLFRRDIGEALARLTHIHYKAGEFTLGLDRAEAKVIEVERATSHIAMINAASDPAVGNVLRLQEIVRISPRAAVLEAWILIEEAAGRSGFIQGADVPRINASLFVDWLVKTGRLPKASNELIRELRNLRDQAAAHTSATTPPLDLTVEEAQRYIDLAAKASSMILDPSGRD